MPFLLSGIGRVDHCVTGCCSSNPMHAPAPSVKPSGVAKVAPILWLSHFVSSFPSARDESLRIGKYRPWRAPPRLCLTRASTSSKILGQFITFYPRRFRSEVGYRTHSSDAASSGATILGVGFGSTAVHPLSCGNRQQWVETGHSHRIIDGYSNRLAAATCARDTEPRGGV